MSQEWLNGVIENSGQACGNCGQWRILKSDRPYFEQWPDDPKNIIEACPNCGDEAYDIYEVADDGP